MIDQVERQKLAAAQAARTDRPVFDGYSIWYPPGRDGIPICGAPESNRLIESSRYLYLARLVTYGSEHPIKVGISKNVCKRMHNLGFSPSLLAVFEFETEKLARIVERATLERFPRWQKYPHLRSTELILADYRETAEYVRRFNPSRFIALL